MEKSILYKKYMEKMWEYDFTKEYDCSPTTSCTDFTRLQYMIINSFPIEIIEKYLDHNPKKINTTNFAGWTSLMIICRNQNIISDSLNIAKLLLAKGAKVNNQNKSGATALMLVVSCTRHESSDTFVRLLLDHGAELELQEIMIGWTALMLAVATSGSTGTEETVRLLLESGADPNKQDKDGWTPLMIASKNSNKTSTKKTVEMLLEYGANRNIRNKDGLTAGMIAANNSKHLLKDKKNSSRLWSFFGLFQNKKQTNNQLADNKCAVCMDKDIDMVIVVCGHLCCCTDCLNKMNMCPICRKEYDPSTDLLKVFSSKRI